MLQEGGFDGVISIEHEDVNWGFGDDSGCARRKEGLLEGLRVLRGAPTRASKELPQS